MPSKNRRGAPTRTRPQPVSANSTTTRVSSRTVSSPGSSSLSPAKSHRSPSTQSSHAPVFDIPDLPDVDNNNDMNGTGVTEIGGDESGYGQEMGDVDMGDVDFEAIMKDIDAVEENEKGQQNGSGTGTGSADQAPYALGGDDDVEHKEEEGGDEEEEADEDDDDDDDEDDEDDEDEDDEEEDEDADGDGDGDGTEQGDGDGATASGSINQEKAGSQTIPDCPTGLTFRYPSAVKDFTTLQPREKAFKVARFLQCQSDGCECPGLEPPMGRSVVRVTRKEMQKQEKEKFETDVDMEGVEAWRSDEGWWKRCGRCGHGWEDTQSRAGHVWAEGVNEAERRRREKVVGRIEELLQDEDLLTTFPTPHPESITSLIKQLDHFVRPSGKKPVNPLPAALDMASPAGSGSGTPFTPREGGTPGGSDDERPRKRRRNGTTGTDGAGSQHDEEEEVAQDQDGAASPRQGKKPGGKTAGKGTMPRTVVRGARGLVPMEMDAEGNQHVAGHLPDSAVTGNREKQVQDGVLAEDEEGDDIPLAQRPQLDVKEKRRRELQKEKEREREAEVVRRLTTGVNVEDGVAVSGEPGEAVDVEIWEGVELPKLPPRPAMIEQQNNEIILPVVSSRNPTPVATILLIGLKNLFQRQLPKMPREYITRLVLDKNHISMAIVKRGWKVVGGICYRPFESRGFAEIVFCAVDSSEQIKGYGGHLMNSIKDHVRKAHPSITHFLTYADNYAVGYFRKQGFSKEISFERERWVGYIKDYEGGTIMQCHMLPKVRYCEVHQMLADQKAAILAKIRTISRSHIVHPGLEVFKNRKPGEVIKLSKEDVPGLAESGWNPELDAIIRQPKRNPHHVLLQLVLNDLQEEPSAWPFIKPVDGSVVHDYYEVITEPMDLQTMEYKLENNHYSSVDDFLADAQLIFDNCRKYNGEKSTYTTQANKLEKALDKIMKKRQLP